MDEFLIQFAVQATRVIVPIITFFGIVSNSLNILVLTRPTLIHRACSLYFSCLAIMNLFYSVVILTINLLADGYQLNLSLSSVFSCKLINYLANFCSFISVYVIVLASIDRYCASSMHARIRNFSSVRVARWAIGFVIITFIILMCWTLVAYDLERIGLLQCVVRSDSLANQVFLVIDVVLYAIVAPFCMILFGFLTIQNTNRMRLDRDQISRYRRTEHQLSRMLLLQVGTHILLTTPVCTAFFMSILPISIRYTIEFYYISIICKLPFYLTFTTPFFLYILSAQVYRNELIQLFRKILPNCRVDTTHPRINTNLTNRQIHPAQIIN